MNKKGFTLIELIGVIVLLSLVMSMATFALSKYLIQGRDRTFKILVNSMEDAVLDAYTACLADSSSSDFCLNHELKTAGQSDKIMLSELIAEGFIEKVKNPWKASEDCDNSSYVNVTRETNDAISFKYETCLRCGTHISNGCN